MISNLLDRMKFPFRKNKEFLTALYDILGFYPHRIEVYRIAFSHKSINYTFDKDKKQYRKPSKPRSDYTSRPLNNERLEFLGDAVIETVVSDILFRHFEHKREGFLTSTRSKIVQREALNRLATDMGLDRLIQAAQGTDTTHTNIGGNAFEALMGAIYLDRGYKHCHWFISNRIIGHYVDIDNVAQKEVNFKSKLLEWSQKNRISINYRDFSRKNEGKGFGTVLTIEGITVSRGEGRSKKESQQEASKEALTRMRRDDDFYDSLFRAKEKRTAMEAEESFALPKIDEIEKELAKTSSQKSKTRTKPPVLERKKATTEELSEEAYDAAYDENASYEVIDTPPEEHLLTAADYAAKGLPAPPEANDIEDDEEKMRHSHQHRTTAHEAVREKAETRKPKKEKKEESPKPQKKEAQKPVPEPQENSKDTPAEKPAKPAQNKKPGKKENFSNGFVIVKDIPQDIPDIPEEEASEEVETSAKNEQQEKIVSQAPQKDQEEKTEDKSIAVAEQESAEDVNVPVETQEEPAEAPRTEVQEPAPAPAPLPFDDTDFGIFEVDNLPDITGNDEPEQEVPELTEEKDFPLSDAEEEEETDMTEEEGEEGEKEDDEENPADAPARTASANESAIRPQLRHISLDDFVFGIDHSENEPLDDDELATTQLPPAQPQKPRRRKRKPAAPLTEEERTDNAKSQNRRKSHTQKKRTDSERSEKSENAGESHKKPASQRRRRKPTPNDGQGAAE